MKNIVRLLTLSAFIFTTGLAFAQEPEPAGKPELKVSGTIFAQAEVDLNDDDAKDTMYTYSVTRAYVHIKTKLTETFSARVSTDVAATDDGGKDKYIPYLKYAYMQAKPMVGGAQLDIMAGMIGTPIADVVYKHSDYRWVYNHYAVDKQSALLESDLGESTADLGIRVGLSMGMINVIYANTNGEGYKDVSEGDNSGKAHYGVVQVNPIKPLFITGYIRYETEEIENSNVAGTTDITVMYYGGGVAWDTDLIKAGLYASLGQREDDGATVNDGMIIDSYVNVNLNSVAGVPVLIMGNFAYGVDSGDNAGTDDDTVTHFGFGVGYKFNDYVRMIAYYDHTTADDGSSETTDKMAYLKLEAKFK